MAMGSREWRAWLADWTRRYLDWGADGMYYDQLNATYPNGRLYPDFDTYGCWMPATLDTIAKIRRASRAKDPYYTSSGEICNDVYGQQLDLHMTSGVWNRLEFYRYCLPRQLLIDGAWNGGLSPGLGGAARTKFIWQVGARFDHVPEDQRLLPLRRAVKSLLYDATFRDTVGIVLRDAAGNPLAPEYSYTADRWQNAPVQGASARWFLIRRDGQRGAIVNLLTVPVQKGATCAIRTGEFGPVASALAVTIDGAWLPIAGRQDGDAFTFSVPETECSSVVLADKMAPLVEWSIDPAAAPGARRALTLKLTNPNAELLTGSARLRLPDEWKAPKVVQFSPIRSGQSQTLTLPLTVPVNARKGRTDLWCDIVTPAGNFSAYSLLVVNDPVVADFRGHPGSYHLWLKNLLAEPLRGTVRVAGRDGLRASAPAEFTLPPEAEVRLPVDVSGHDKLREISEVSATVTIGRQTLQLVRGVMPTVPNGDFESDGAGDRKPDWWMCRKVADEWAYERLHLAEGSHGGKFCLQLDPPQPGEKFTRAYPVHGAFRFGARYRVSVWIKSESTAGVWACVAVPLPAWKQYVLGAGQTGSGWRQFSTEFVQGDGPAAFVSLYNESSAAAFFDDLTIEEMGTKP
jgi:hypothetical protein